MRIIAQEPEKDPVFKGGIAGLLRYAREVWLASSALKQQGDVLLPTRLEGLAKAVNRAASGDQGVAASVKGRAGSFGMEVGRLYLHCDRKRAKMGQD